MTDASLYADACVPSSDERWDLGIMFRWLPQSTTLTDEPGMTAREGGEGTPRVRWNTRNIVSLRVLITWSLQDPGENIHCNFANSA